MDKAFQIIKRHMTKGTSISVPTGYDALVKEDNGKVLSLLSGEVYSANREKDIITLLYDMEHVFHGLAGAGGVWNTNGRKLGCYVRFDFRLGCPVKIDASFPELCMNEYGIDDVVSTKMRATLSEIILRCSKYTVFDESKMNRMLEHSFEQELAEWGLILCGIAIEWTGW